MSPSLDGRVVRSRRRLKAQGVGLARSVPMLSTDLTVVRMATAPSGLGSAMPGMVANYSPVARSMRVPVAVASPSQPVPVPVATPMQPRAIDSPYVRYRSVKLPVWPSES